MSCLAVRNGSGQTQPTWLLRQAISKYLHRQRFTIVEPNPGMLAVLLTGPQSADDTQASFAWAIYPRDYLTQDAPAQMTQAAA